MASIDSGNEGWFLDCGGLAIGFDGGCFVNVVLGRWTWFGTFEDRNGAESVRVREWSEQCDNFFVAFP